MEDLTACEPIEIRVQGPRIGFAEDHVILNPHLSHGAVHLYVCMTMHVGPSGNGTIPPLDQLAEEIGENIDMTHRYEEELVREGLASRTEA